MEIEKINGILEQLSADPQNGRDHILALSRALIEWMGFEWVENDRPRLLDFGTLKLKEALVPAPVTGQEQIYRLTSEGQNLKVRLAVLKKYDKKMIQYFAETMVGLTSYQARMRGVKQVEGREPYISNNPYFLHFVTTAKYDRLWVIFNEAEQMRVLVFRNRLSQTQYNKILPVWKNISARPKPEMARLLWKSLDIKEVNKEFYKHIKERFDTLVGFAKIQNTGLNEEAVKQFAVRLIGRYIFCWFLKEKGVIPEKLLASSTISGTAGFDKNVLAPLFFKTLNTPVTEREIIQPFNQIIPGANSIPYLNGGLFDFHTEDVLFDQLDLNNWLATFVKVLEEFDFTVDESNSQYQMVAIDPEMLGRIFENLLASQNPDTEKMANQRKAFGAFYTPREIVDYMVNESLRTYLETQLLPVLPETTNQAAEPAVAYKGTLFENVANEPASPSTALSRAELADMERRRERMKEKIDKLFATGCTDSPFDKEDTKLVRKALEEVTMLDPACGSGAFPMGIMLRLMELRQVMGHGHRNSYDLKEEILSRNIFGVDIMPMAVEIARLRAWLSLVLEADYRPADRKNNFGIAALPNLDFKFICANSLIDSGYDAFLGKIQYNATLYRLDGEIQKLETIRNQYFDPRGDKNRKTELQHEFIATKQHIKEQIAVGSLIKNYKLGDFFEKVDDWNPFDDSHPSSFFSPAWMFGITDGFDVVIGNPPYVQMQKGIYSSDTFPFSEGKDKGKQNLYKVFVEVSYNYLKQSGTASMIVQSSLLCDLSSTYTRELLLTKTELKKVLEYPKSASNSEAQVFDSVLQGTCTYIFSKLQPSKEHYVEISIHNDTSTISNPNFEKINQLSLLKLYPDTNYIPLISKGDSLALNRISTCSIPFSDYIESTNQGDLNLTTSANEFSDNDTHIKLYRGRNIHKFHLINLVEEYVNPNFRKEKVIENQKHTFIVLQEITGTTDKFRIHACLTNKEEKFLWGHTANKILLKDEMLNKTCIALLNSKLLDWFFRKTSTNNHVMGYEIKQLPFPKDLKKKQTHIEKLVDQIISLKKQNLDTTALEKEIDVLVYKLYELTYDEVKIIEPQFLLTREEYENYSGNE
ncbi:MAG: hypothetical protein A2W90_02990 [Bacteroidetes bacterium GWF2_42_66]|nr:MAG: hypothetical protein A2W92_10380 [Bacteroidetes bacterium GWA2_42_15]OFY01308.1 MAG: hypothetical protein A2W89_16475 [Bacteroidetes bacterium GWE2_42_39]OFY42152.1 MAG: hypothetical protein A2W90_02990 [Bacteroidetes bacterium GWF2_42_66]HBL77641.1 hypothetical protein [Prolixibacteraceae bacterium]HCB62770.1 hypothetical protein [Bacteroidales bacterium]